jgi:hypothetical protein
MIGSEADQQEIGASRRSSKNGRSDREFLRSALAEPGVARQSFLLIEVLGPPVSLRSNSVDRST